MDPVVAVVLRAALALLLSVAAAHKLRDRAAFRATLEAYALLPARALGAVAAVVPATEVVAAALLATPRAGRAGALVAAALLALYALAMGVNVLRGRRDLDCGCMGPGARSPVGAALVVRNLVLVTAALAVALVAPAPRALAWVDALTVPCAVAVLAALYAAIERVLALAPTVAALRREVRS